MHMPFAVVPPSVWIFTLWPIALLALMGVTGMAAVLWALLHGPTPVRNPARSAAPSAPELAVMTGEIATIPSGGPMDSLAA